MIAHNISKILDENLFLEIEVKIEIQYLIYYIFFQLLQCIV